VIGYFFEFGFIVNNCLLELCTNENGNRLVGDTLFVVLDHLDIELCHAAFLLALTIRMVLQLCDFTFTLLALVMSWLQSIIETI
jgi:hypothetical protein